MKTPHTKRKGFSLVEMLTVIAIIGILATVLFPVVDAAQRRAKKSTALTKLRSIGQAYINWSEGGKSMKITGTWQLPGSQVATNVSQYAANLASDAQLNNAELWFVDGDALLDANPIQTPPRNVIIVAQGATVPTIDQTFQEALTSRATSWEVYSPTSPGLNGNLQAPIGWTRGLLQTGVWGPADGTPTGSVWGPEGGHIVYGDAHIIWTANTKIPTDGGSKDYFLDRVNGTPTPNWTLSKGVPVNISAPLPQN